MDDAVLRGFYGPGTNFTGATLRGALMYGNSFGGNNFTGVSLVDAVLYLNDFTLAAWRNVRCPDGSVQNTACPQVTDPA
jgi:hypothetical protein